MPTGKGNKSAINWQKVEAIQRLEAILSWIKSDTAEVVDLHTVQRDLDNCMGITVFYEIKPKFTTYYN